jgi:hypothetical protein
MGAASAVAGTVRVKGDAPPLLMGLAAERLEADARPPAGRPGALVSI